MDTPINTATFSVCSTYNTTYDRVDRHLKEVPDGLKRGLALRIVNHARERLEGSGFGLLIASAESIDVDMVQAPWGTDKVTDHTFHVSFVNSRGGAIGVHGIQLNRYGWPEIDHGFSIE